MANNARYGRSRYGTFKYGERPQISGMAQAWDDTVFMAKLLAPNTDRSQFATDTTSQAEANSTRTQLTGGYPEDPGREVLWKGQLDTALTGDLVRCRHGSNGDRWAINWDGTDVTCRVNDSDTSLAITTSIITATAEEIGIMWSTRFNPDNTGAGNRVLGTLLIYNHDQSTEERMTIAHGASTFDGTETFEFMLDDTSDISIIRVSAAYHDPVEYYEEFVSQRPAVTTQTTRRTEPFVHRQTDGVGAEGEFFGQAHSAMAADMARQADLRLVSPVWNQAIRSGSEYLADTGTPWARLAPDDDDYYMMADLVRWVALPPNCDLLRARVHVRTYATDASTPTIGVRLYCFDGLPANPWLLGQQTVKYTFAEGTLSADHTSTRGEYIDLGSLEALRSPSKIAGWPGTCVLALAVCSEPGGTADSNDRLYINSIQVWPDKRDYTGQGPAGGLVLP